MGCGGSKAVAPVAIAPMTSVLKLDSATEKQAYSSTRAGANLQERAGHPPARHGPTAKAASCTCFAARAVH